MLCGTLAASSLWSAAVAPESWPAAIASKHAEAAMALVAKDACLDACDTLSCPRPHVPQAIVATDGGCSCRCKLPQEQPSPVLLFQSKLPSNGTNARWDYYRVPKSGSTAIESFIHDCEKVEYHDHGNGCAPLSVCDAKAIYGPSFTVLRRPSDRVRSQFLHLHSRAGLEGWAKNIIPTEAAFLEWLRFTFKDCEVGHARCRVDAINERFKPPGIPENATRHRVILYPQSFFTRKRTELVCYDKEELAERFASFMTSNFPSSCAMKAEDVKTENISPEKLDSEFGDEPAFITDNYLLEDNIYPEDVNAWRVACSDQLALASHRWGAAPPRPSASLWNSLNKVVGVSAL